MKIPKSEKLFYGLAGGTIVLAGGLLFLQNSALDSLRSDVQTLKAKAESEKDARVKLVQSSRDLADLRTQLAHLEQGIPDAAYVPTMLKELEAMGKTQSVEVTGLRPAAKKPAAFNGEKKSSEAKPYEPLDLELKGKASYTDLLKFVAALNSFPKILEVRTITISPKPSGALRGADTRMEITMGIRAFLFKQATSTPPKKDGLST